MRGGGQQTVIPLEIKTSSSLLAEVKFPNELAFDVRLKIKGWLVVLERDVSI